MNRLTKTAIRSKSWHDFLNEVQRWLKWYRLESPKETHNKQTLYDFYIQVKEVHCGFSREITRNL